MATRFTSIALIPLLLVSIACATPTQGGDLKPLIDSALTDMQCRSAFEVGVMNATISGFKQMGELLGPNMQAMQDDGAVLRQYAGKDDVQNYSTYLHETFGKHLKQNGDALAAGFEKIRNQTQQQANQSGAGGGGTGPGGDGGSGPGGGQGGAGGAGGSGGQGGGQGGNQTGEQGMTPDEMKAAMGQLQAKYAALKDDYDSCFDVGAHARLVIDYYNSSLEKYEARARNMAARGINASNLLALIGEAKTAIVEPLGGHVKTAANSSQIRMSLFQYCLYDGCANGTNFHMAAKYEAMRLGDVIAALASNATAAGFGGNVSAAQSSLGDANAEIMSWGANNATPTELQEVWAGINTAARHGRGIMAAMNNTG